MYTYTCPNCNRQFTTPSAVQRVRCPYCNQDFQTAYTNTPIGQPTSSGNIGIFDEGPSGKSRGVAALLAFFLGGLGIHYFYVGKTTPGIVFLAVTLLTCGFGGILTGIVSLIQAVIMITQSHDDFERKWVNPAESFPLF